VRKYRHSAHAARENRVAVHGEIERHALSGGDDFAFEAAPADTAFGAQIVVAGAHGKRKVGGLRTAPDIATDLDIGGSAEERHLQVGAEIHADAGQTVLRLGHRDRVNIAHAPPAGYEDAEPNVLGFRGEGASRRRPRGPGNQNLAVNQHRHHDRPKREDDRSGD